MPILQSKPLRQIQICLREQSTFLSSGPKEFQCPHSTSCRTRDQCPVHAPALHDAAHDKPANLACQGRDPYAPHAAGQHGCQQEGHCRIDDQHKETAETASFPRPEIIFVSMAPMSTEMILSITAGTPMEIIRFSFAVLLTFWMGTSIVS